ncbi:MAG: PmoA family protein, partial [Bacteroidales bacterium]|nr:PmoA family protein [Bacteroidales bacterium]
MKLKSIFIVLITIIFSLSCVAQSTKQVQKGKGLNIAFVNKEADKKIDVMIDGKLFTSYCWYDNVFKPVLYPVYTSAGTEITRGFPLKPRPGERTDHRHQIGIWLNYGNVDGFDFWDNGASGTKDPE